MIEIEKFVKDLLDKKNLFNDFFNKTLPFGIHQVIEYLEKENMLESFIDQSIDKNIDDVYLIHDSEKKLYKLISTERGYIVDQKEYKDNLEAIHEKIRLKAAYNLTKFKPE